MSPSMPSDRQPSPAPGSRVANAVETILDSYSAWYEDMRIPGIGSTLPGPSRPSDRQQRPTLGSRVDNALERILDSHSAGYEGIIHFLLLTTLIILLFLLNSSPCFSLIAGFLCHILHNIIDRHISPVGIMGEQTRT